MIPTKMSILLFFNAEDEEIMLTMTVLVTNASGRRVRLKPDISDAG